MNLNNNNNYPLYFNGKLYDQTNIDVFFDALYFDESVLNYDMSISIDSKTLIYPDGTFKHL
jgi:hypothetical protein